MKYFHFLLVFVFIVAVNVSMAQNTEFSTLRGKVSDNNGELLIGATVVLTLDKSQGTITDLNGNYSLKIPGNGERSITVSYVGYKSTEEVVILKSGQIVVQDFMLSSASVNIKEAVITAKAVRAADSYMQKIKAKSTINIDYISASTIKKTGDASVSAAVARVTGVSTSGSFITVRGIGDRYVNTTINGLRIPTLDAFTNNIKLDLFPASLVDNIIISKTLSPDLSSEWSGAYLSIETKDYPEKLTITVESSVEFNPQTSMKDVISSQRSNTDWLGYDNSFREHDHHSFYQVNPDPSTYHEFVALGLGEYFNSLGIDENTPWNSTYYKLGLVQLGLLPPALINDPLAVQNAMTAYTDGDYKNQAFNIINTKAAISGQSFPNNWSTSKISAPFNFSQSFTIGNQVNFRKSTLGYLAGFKFGNTIISDPHSYLNRSYTDTNNIILSINGITQQSSRESNGWSALIGASMKFNKNNSFSLLFMPNYSGINSVRNGTDTIDAFEKGNQILSQYYEHREQIVYQFKSDHYVPFLKMKMNFNASFTNGKSNIPDFKDLIFTGLEEGYGSIVSANRYFRYLSERLNDYQANIEFPVSNKSGYIRRIKAGASYQSLERKFGQYKYMCTFPNGFGSTFQNSTIGEFFSLQNFGITTSEYSGREYSVVNIFYDLSKLPSNHSVGNRHLGSGYLMLDYDILSSIRLAGGVRYETFNIYTDATLFDSLQLNREDERRNYPGEFFLILPSNVHTVDWVPSVAFVYKIRKDENFPVTLRLNYGKSVLRPSIRECYDGIMFDYELRANVFGNSELKPSYVNNFDFRFETYFKSGDNLSLSLFYKDFKNHIELISMGGGYSWMNVDKSFVRGLEIEGRKIIARNFEFKANISWIYSQTDFVLYKFEIIQFSKFYTPLDTLSRTMYGQAPYVVNAMLNYSNDSIGLTASLNYNLQGPRLVIASMDKMSDIYEMPRHLLDFKISQRINKNISISFSVRDILNSPIERSYNFPGAGQWKIDYDRYRYGTAYKLSFNYRF
ncbi:MAG: carboxypeptidase-like regulatory domain-containing protein [Bacteroidales bacterium]